MCAKLAFIKDYYYQQGVKPGRVRDMVVLAAKPKQKTVGNGVR